MVKYLVLLFVSLAGVAIGVAAYVWHVNLPLISPLDVISSLAPNAAILPQPQRVVYGFLPYWNMKYSDQIPLRYITHLAYFGIDLNDDGSLREFDKPGEAEPGLRQLKSTEFSVLARQIKLTGKKSILLVRAFDPEQIESIVNSPKASQTAIDSIMELVVGRRFDGINVDFEYVGAPDEQTRDNFTRFVADLARSCRAQLSGCEISVDVFADTSVKNRLWDLQALAPHVDHIIVMAYDYYRPSSNQAGPVAPLRGACGTGFGAIAGTSTDKVCLEYDVTKSMADTLKQVSAEKIIMGIPFYGYEWRTASVLFLANTYPRTGGTATYRRIRELLETPPEKVGSISAQWNPDTLSPYIVYDEDGELFQIHYEDTRSLGLKLDLVNQTNLGGIAIWALGYESPYEDLWDVIADKLYR
jgi:spore germination protein YaaH